MVSSILILTMVACAWYILFFLNNKISEIDGDFLNLKWWQWSVIAIGMAVLGVMLWWRC